MEQKKQEPIRDARQLGTAKMLILGLQHMFAMFGATILVPILVSGYFQKACGEPLTRGLSVIHTEKLISIPLRFISMDLLRKSASN